MPYATTPDLSTVDDPVLRPPATNSKEIVSHRVVTDKPAAPVDGSETWEKGDIAWDANPTKTGPVGWRCIRAGTWGALPDPLTIDVDPLDRTKVTFSSFAELPLWLWGYIDIEGVGVVQIVSRPEAGADATVFVDPAVPGVDEDDLPVSWAEPLIVPFGNQSTRSTSVDDDELTAYDHHVSCTAVPLNIKLPPDPWDGAYFEIKDATGDAQANPITVKGNGNDIDADMNPTTQIDENFGALAFRYNAAAEKWFTVGAYP